MAEKTVLIAGATGVVGNAALEHFAGAGWRAIAVSRRPPECHAGPFRHLAVDLTDAPACRAAFSDLRDVTHIVYAALFEKPGLVRGWTESDQMQTNLAMLRNLLEPVNAAASGLEHVTLLQGTKAYGAHLHEIALPARERAPRDPHENFYWLQEDYLRRMQSGADWVWTIFRPQIVFGFSYGTAMNLIPVIGAFAAICREEDRPFGFPGGAFSVLEAVDADLLARAIAWAAEGGAGPNETFNVTNGDVFAWRDVWPALAHALGVRMGPDAPLRLSAWLPERGAVWDRVVARNHLRKLSLRALLGQSHDYADLCFGYGIDRAIKPALVSTIKIRQAGFADCVDTEDMFRRLFQLFVERRILPAP